MYIDNLNGEWDSYNNCLYCFSDDTEIYHVDCDDYSNMVDLEFYCNHCGKYFIITREV